MQDCNLRFMLKKYKIMNLNSSMDSNGRNTSILFFAQWHQRTRLLQANLSGTRRVECNRRAVDFNLNQFARSEYDINGPVFV